ncbi:Mu transposase C-terminal domain-containing protein [Bacillus sp. CGMCC 1.16541]|uniref:Mu transposase C-terminal domain-containing protein n=1 Tax=Bacillus sp. CGMCC 1.16541 TaxID=2185143 RepID=UPI000D7360D9|nr:Mu transposase C-terminal domain-containing protein [Bacillus sp. CGMCC 1.16541]
MESVILLSTKEVAELLGITKQAVSKKINNGELTAMVDNAKKRGGRAGKQFLIPLSSLPPKAQKKYLAQQRKPSDIKEEIEAKPFEEFTESEREQIAFWRKCLDDWQKFRSQGGKKTERDIQFVELWNIQQPDHELSIPTLYRKYKMWQEKGDIALVDKRGGWNRGQSEIPEIAWAIFEQLYLHEGRPSIRYVYKLVSTWAKHEMPQLLPLPSYETFQRNVKSIPLPVIRLFRFGEKDYEDKAAPYILRKYEELASNEIWVADNHEIDVIVERKNGSQYRPWITAYQDVRSRKIVGKFVSEKPTSDTNLYALRDGILRYGIPSIVYTDNGMDFLVTDIAGRGRRKTRKKAEGEHQPPPIFERLGIEMWNAKVKNARAKIVERAFLDFKNEFSRICSTFTGGNITERPESLKYTLKDGKLVMPEDEFKDLFNKYIEGWFNHQEHSGQGMKGKSPNQVYAENLVVKRTATEEDLNLMLMRSSRMLKVGRMGVALTMYGEKFFYAHDDLIAKYQGQSVYIRFDPENMGQVRVYDQEDRYILTAVNREALSYNATKDDLKKFASEAKRLKKLTKERGEAAEQLLLQKGVKAPTALDIMQMEAEYNIANQEEAEAKVIEPVRANEKPIETVLPRASGDDEASVVDLNRMINNLKRFKQGGNSDE